MLCKICEVCECDGLPGGGEKALAGEAGEAGMAPPRVPNLFGPESLLGDKSGGGSSARGTLQD